MTVFLYYGHKEAETPEERNEYKRIYCKWHPQSYSFRNLNLQEYRNIRIQGEDSDDEIELPPLISYDSDDDYDNPLARNTDNNHTKEYSSVRYAQLPDTMNHLVDESTNNSEEMVVIDTNQGPRVNYYSKKAIEVAQAVNHPRKIGKV